MHEFLTIFNVSKFSFKPKISKQSDKVVDSSKHYQKKPEVFHFYDIRQLLEQIFNNLSRVNYVFVFLAFVLNIHLKVFFAIAVSPNSLLYELEGRTWRIKPRI